jgi:ClpP class serine protease
VKFQRIIQAVYFEPWSITREGWQSVHAMIKPRVLSDALPELPKAANDDTDFFGSPLPKMQLIGRTAVIPIQGTLVHHATLMDKQCGACSYDDVKRDVRAALNIAGLQKIVYHCDSPGGMCMGCAETAKVIDEAAALVRSEAVTDGLMCSACYDLVCGVDRISCTPTAVVGSIGAMMAWLDQTVRYEMAGLKVELFASDSLKGTGTPGTALTDEQREYLQARTDKYASLFKSHVTAGRLVSDATMRGQTFIGSDAVEVGLVDGIVDDCEECF